MRTAQICPTCATYTNAVCVLYDGPYLENIQLPPMTNIEDAFSLVNDAFASISSTVAAIGLPEVLAVNDTALSNDININGLGANVVQLISTPGSFTTSLTANNATANRAIDLPNGGGTLARSVNGNLADSTGNVSLGGYTGTVTVGMQTLTFTNGVLISVV